MAIYHIEPSETTVHGTFSREHPPVLTIDPGDTVVYRTLDAGWHIEAMHLPTDPEVHPPYSRPHEKFGYGHCLSGPVAIRGAEPGMTLEVQIEEIRVGAWGWQGCGGWKSRFHNYVGTEDEPQLRCIWELDAERMVGKTHLGYEVDLGPFMGVMGMPPDEPGLHSTAPPRVTGGNLDCKELVEGTSLFLPVAVSGGLFSVGDGHGVQGDGEACGTAIECPMERLRLTFRLHPGMHIPTPRARLNGAWLTVGVHGDLDEACLMALKAMVDLMIEQNPTLDRKAALLLASLVVDLRVTQIVNGVQGVHAVLRDGALR